MLCSCRDKTAVADEKGEPLKLSLSQVTKEGFYVYDKGNETFQPVLSGFGGSSLYSPRASFFSSDNEEITYLWIASQEYDVEIFIPRLDGKEKRLVYFQGSESNMPGSYAIEKYQRLGYTLGIHFTFADTGNSLFLDNTDDKCSGSSASKIMEGSSAELLRVHKINENAKLPLKNIDTEVNMILGLEKEKKYQVGFFDGTQYEDEDFVADTLAFKSQKLIALETPFDVTEEGFFYIKLPKNLKNGYYYINGSGMFRYTGEN